MDGDLSVWRNLELDVEVSCEAAGRGPLVENLPLSSQRGILYLSKEGAVGEVEVEDGQGVGFG